jgi:hypothetical protein
VLRHKILTGRISTTESNATGVYSGANAVPNGSGLRDLANLNNSALRGVQKTSEDGVVQFDTIFPGHYFSRAIHIHFMAHINATEYPNGTIWNNKSSHVGQGFFDNDLIQLVRTVPPYSTNMQPFTNNSNDNIVIQEAKTSDPFFHYVLLGNHVQDGILAWLRFGINTSFHRDVQVAAFKYKEGGEMNTNNPTGPMNSWFPGGFPTGYYETPSGGVGATGLPTGFPPGLTPSFSTSHPPTPTFAE